MMQRYIDQLIEDLEHAAQTPPAPHYFEVPPHLEELPDVAELALAPYKTIEELSGIQQEFFPSFLKLNDKQCIAINIAIFKVFDSLRIELVDAPDDLPPEILYDALTSNWNYPVQYLPSTGMDLELCTGDPEDCPYGDYCDCGEEFDEYELPARFYDYLKPIAMSIDHGSICYLNPDTMEMEQLPQMLIEDPHEFEMITGFGLKDADLKHTKWSKCYEFKPLDSHESFQIMYNYTHTLDEESILDELIDILYKSKPFAGFKHAIHRYGLSDDWYQFKNSAIETHVKMIIFNEVNHISEIDWDDELPF